MFLRHYKLANNPFAPQTARPFFLSHSARQALIKLDHVLEGTIHCLHISGPAGVGKSTLIGRRVRELDDYEVSWVQPGTKDPVEFLSAVLADLGLESVEGAVTELRHILEVYLQHQAGQGRKSLLIADGLETLSGRVLRELEWISQLRWRSRPVIQLILATRNEDLTRNLLPESSGIMRTRHEHQRLTGFMLDETQTYIRACLHGAGCYWEEELIPEEVIVDVQGFTRGIVADVNALCYEALNMLAERISDTTRQPKVARLLLKEVGAKLDLKYDPSAWQLVEEALTPEAVQLSNPEALRLEAARLFVSSRGRTIVEITLDRPRMVLGRDESCDISLDSSYVSRYQNLFMETADGWVMIDLNSTNGSFVNGRRVREHRLRDGDVIAVGRHQMRFAAEQTEEAKAAAAAKSKEAHSDALSTSTADTLITTQNLAGRTVTGA